MVKIIILTLVLLILVMNYKYRNFKSPYKLHMIFGKKGSGKSTILARIAVRSLKKKKPVFTNMTELVVPGVYQIDSSMLGKFVPPPDSVLLLDEVGILYDNRNFKSFSSSVRDFFKLQRHYKVDVYLASQSFDVDKKLRDLTDDMALVVSIFPWLSLVRPIRKSVCLVESSALGESRIADNLKFCWIFAWKFVFLPRWVKYFDSFVAPDLPLFDDTNSFMVPITLDNTRESGAKRSGSRRKFLKK